MDGVRTKARNILLRLDDCLVFYGLSVGVTVGLVSYILFFLFEGR